MGNIKLKRNKRGKKVSLIYENAIEIDEDKIELEVSRLQTRISMMEERYCRLGEEIENAKNKLELLQTVIPINDESKKDTVN